MLLFIVLAPIVAAALILLGAPGPDDCALDFRVLTLIVTLLLFSSFRNWSRLSIRQLVLDQRSVGTAFFVRRRWSQPDHAVADRDRHVSPQSGLPAKSRSIENAFYACLLLIAGGAIGAFASLDLFFFYAFHELALIPTFLLIGIWGSGNRIAAAWKITIYLALGSFILLLGLILLYRSVPEASRSFDFRALQTALPPDKSLPMRSTISICCC